jgi:hypothetical protein
VNNMLDWILSNFSLSLSLCVVVTRLKLQNHDPELPTSNSCKKNIIYYIFISQLLYPYYVIVLTNH